MAGTPCTSPWVATVYPHNCATWTPYDPTPAPVVVNYILAEDGTPIATEGGPSLITET
jgi:hypothetical protein